MSGSLLLLLNACGGTTDPEPTPGRAEGSILQLLPAYLPTQREVGTSTSNGNAALQWAPVPTSEVLLPAAALVAPDTVRAGESFRVQIGSIVPSGCWGVGTTAISQSDRTVLLEPTDVYRANITGIEVLTNVSRTVTVTIATPGPATLRVRGRRVEQATLNESPVTVEKRIVVR